MAEALPVTPAVEVKAEEPKAVEVPAAKPRRIDSWGVKWDGVADETKDAIQAEVDRRYDRVRKNTEQRTRREVDAYYRGKLEAAKSAEPPKPAAPVVEKVPMREDYATDDEFIDAKATHAARKATREESERITKEAEEKKKNESRAEKFTSFQTKVREKFPDIDERLEAVADMTLPGESSDEIAGSDYGPEILNYLSDTKEMERFSKLTGTAALREIGRLEARFESEAKKAAETTAPDTPAPKPDSEAAPAPKPSAPKPIEPIGGRGGPAAGLVIRDGMPYADYVKVRNRQLGRA